MQGKIRTKWNERLFLKASCEFLDAGLFCKLTAGRRVLADDPSLRFLYRIARDPLRDTRIMCDTYGFPSSKDEGTGSRLIVKLIVVGYVDSGRAESNCDHGMRSFRVGDIQLTLINGLFSGKD